VVGLELGWWWGYTAPGWNGGPMMDNQARPVLLMRTGRNNFNQGGGGDRSSTTRLVKIDFEQRDRDNYA
jgi:hypothetical protein